LALGGHLETKKGSGGQKLRKSMGMKIWGIRARREKIDYTR